MYSAEGTSDMLTAGSQLASPNCPSLDDEPGYTTPVQLDKAMLPLVSTNDK
jgi:hypothetical protein